MDSLSYMCFRWGLLRRHLSNRVHLDNRPRSGGMRRYWSGLFLLKKSLLSSLLGLELLLISSFDYVLEIYFEAKRKHLVQCGSLINVGVDEGKVTSLWSFPCFPGCCSASSLTFIKLIGFRFFIGWWLMTSRWRRSEISLRNLHLFINSVPLIRHMLLW